MFLTYTPTISTKNTENQTLKQQINLLGLICNIYLLEMIIYLKK